MIGSACRSDADEILVNSGLDERSAIGRIGQPGAMGLNSDVLKRAAARFAGQDRQVLAQSHFGSRQRETLPLSLAPIDPQKGVELISGPTDQHVHPPPNHPRPPLQIPLNSTLPFTLSQA